jgi:putative acetyltransferase
MELPVDIRHERASDSEAVRDVQRRAFGDDGRVPGLVDALRRDDPYAVSLVAVEAGTVIGHVMFTRALLDAPSQLVGVRVLSPLGVVPERQRLGVGSALVRDGLRRLDADGVPLVFLEGSPTYYHRLGFTPGGELSFRKPSLRIPDAAFQVAALSGYQRWMTGTLVYPATFWEHDCVGLRD